MKDKYLFLNHKQNNINYISNRVFFMKLISFAIKSSFITGAFLSGLALGVLINKDKVLNKFKKMQLKKNDSASTK